MAPGLWRAVAPGLALGPAGEDEAGRIHREAIVVDTYAALQFLYTPDFGRGTRGKLDLPKALSGGITAVNFGLFSGGEYFVEDPRLVDGRLPPHGVQVLDMAYKGVDAVKRMLLGIDAFYRALEENSRDMTLVLTARDLEEAKQEGRLGAILGSSTSWILDSDLRLLRNYHRLGLRILALSHATAPPWASADLDNPDRGLNDFGREVIRECNRLGIVVDVSHASEKTFFDTLEVSSHPILASHSGCRAINRRQRNLTDQQLRALARNGGVLGVTLARFIDDEINEVTRKSSEPERSLAYYTALRKAFPDPFQFEKALHDPELAAPHVAPELRPDTWPRLKLRPRAKVFLQHLDHAVKVAGIDHVGIGTDFNAGSLDIAPDAAAFPRITALLLDHGYSEEEVKKILGGNFLRLFRKVTGS